MNIEIVFDLHENTTLSEWFEYFYALTGGIYGFVDLIKPSDKIYRNHLAIRGNAFPKR